MAGPHRLGKPIAAPMRAGIAVSAFLGLVGLGFAIMAGGHTLVPREMPPEASSIASPDGPKTAAVPKVDPPRPTIRSRGAGQEGQTGPEEFERISPRAPLGEIGLALPPKPAMPSDWEGTILYRPVAPAAGLVEAMGHTVAIAGVDAVAADETCSFEGKEWACGIRARTAFRLWLRGRAVTCAVPPEADPRTITAACRLGKQDVGQWLVSNGWARAAEDGPYGEAGGKARVAKKGIFGRPPDKDSLPPPPSAVSTLPKPPTAPTAPSE
jgi:endonuclease YncB( thermonuclease family)